MPLLWRHRFVQDKWGWELPAGGLLIDEGEEPSATAVRELEEETGYRAGRVEHLVTFQPMVGMVDSEHFVFLGLDPGRPASTETARCRPKIEPDGSVPLLQCPALIDSGRDLEPGSLVGAALALLAQKAATASKAWPRRLGEVGGCGGAGGLSR